MDSRMIVLLPSFVIVCLQFVGTHGGSCWILIGSNGRCRGYEGTQVSYDECCANTEINRGWTPNDNPNNGQLFFWQAVTNGAPQCRSCLQSCDRVRCSGYKRCRMRHGRPRCVCDPDCASLDTLHPGYVCGTDRRTYKNHCSLVKHLCRNGGHLEINFYGKCQPSCSSVACDVGKYCVEDQHGLPHCVQCREQCRHASGRNRVCGADGLTYSSLCEFQRQTCMSESLPIGLAYMGICRENITCADLHCGSNKRCMRDPSTGWPRCVTCINHCRDIPGSPRVCGTDGVTYHSYCTMKRLSCASRIYLDTAYSGSCR